MRTGRNAMRSAGIDARNGALGKRSRHRVDLLSPRILPTHADRGKAIVRPIVRPSAGWRWCAVERYPPGETIGRGRYICRGSHADEVLCVKCYITDITDIIPSGWLAVMPLDIQRCHPQTPLPPLACPNHDPATPERQCRAPAHPCRGA